ncbi:MAG: hypothetical protein ACE5DS_09960, partial [Kiloniellaceae bacterium]
MTDPIDPPFEPGPLDPMRPHTDPQAVRAWPAPFLWAVIILCTLTMMVLILMEQRSTPPPADPAAGNLIVEMQSRLIFAIHEMAPLQQSSTDITDQIDQLRSASTRPGVAWRLGALEMALAGNRETALDHVLDQLSLAQADPTDQATTEMHELVVRAVRDPDSLNAAEKSTLADELGWAGNLLAAGNAQNGDPHWQTARSAAIKTFAILIGAFFFYLLAGFVGLVLLIIAVIRMVGREPAFRFRQLSTSVNQGVYLEAFALYLTLSLTLPLMATVIVVSTAGQASAQSTMLPVGLAALAIASILGVIWPMWRGARWHDVRRDLGLHSGRGVFIEILCGIVGYVTVLPLLGIGIILTFFFVIVAGLIEQMVRSPASPPHELAGHPIFEMLADPSAGAIIGVLFLASIFAPFFEETLFRGALLNG